MKIFYFVLPLITVIFFSEDVRSQSDSSSRQACYKFEGPCNRYPEWGGSRDDSEWAYENRDVGKNRDNCLLRAKEYFEWCGNGPEDPVLVVHMPTGFAGHTPNNIRSLRFLFVVWNFSIRKQEKIELLGLT
jgi:hypothetical protein